MKRTLSPAWIALWVVVICLAAGHLTAMAAKKEPKTAKTPQVAAGPPYAKRHRLRQLPREGRSRSRCRSGKLALPRLPRPPWKSLLRIPRRRISPDRNPHKSHLGDIACTVCHHEHSPSKVYCLDCHARFDMKLPVKPKK